jgi:multicomponent Na+:H+ antiporter subunit E
MLPVTSLITLAALWGLLSGGEFDSWLIGVPSVAAAFLVRQRLRPFAARKVSIPGAVRYLIAFFKVSFVSGLDVALRAFHPRLPLNPGLIEYAMRLRSPAEILLLAGTVNLQPGTLSADLDGERLTVHALDVAAPIVSELRRLEEQVAAIRPGPPSAAASGGGDHG